MLAHKSSECRAWKIKCFIWKKSLSLHPFVCIAVSPSISLSLCLSQSSVGGGVSWMMDILIITKVIRMQHPMEDWKWKRSSVWLSILLRRTGICLSDLETLSLLMFSVVSVCWFKSDLLHCPSVWPPCDSFSDPPCPFCLRYDHSFEIYSDAERLYLFGTDSPDSMKEWVKSIAKVTLGPLLTY